ncbi:MAG: rhomboid family intramembrane serine protease [Hespellia sp.]|nr:rhomboid family intramembrane serine protease [Hespellia sp.]
MNRNKKAYCTIILVMANVVVFLYLSFFGMTEDGGFMLQHGAMYTPFVMEQGEYYRIFTSMFLHFGINHLLNNMITLLVLGWTLENEIGRVKYLMIYFIGGLGGNLLSMGMELRTQDYAVSAGASGAIFGIVGALVYMAVRNRGRIGNVSGRGLIFMCALTLYNGFTTTGIDNAAHIGGAVTGFVLAVVLYHKKRIVRYEREEF